MGKIIAKYLIIIALALSSCSGYEKLLKSSDYEKKYMKAINFYEEGDYVKSYNLFEQCLSVFMGTVKADSLNYYLAMSYFKNGDYITAGYYFRNFEKVYSRSPFAEECAFNGGYCYYLMSPRPSLDQTDSYQAIDAFTMFMIRYPDSKKSDKCKELITELRNKLVEKSYKSAKLYYDLEEYKAAIIALQNSLSDFPDTWYREEIMYMLLKSRHLLAKNSVQSKKTERYQSTLDEYYSFVTEFPESEFRQQADKIYMESNDFLKD